MAMRNGCCLLLLALSLASGQQPAVNLDARKEILDYPLTTQRADRLISVLPLMTQFFMSQPRDVLDKWVKMTAARKIANLQNSAQAMAILKPYGLTAKDYVIGLPALRMAVWRAEGVPESSKVYASAPNLAFAKANLAQLKPKWEAVDGAPHPK
jgi:hypothetical protein